MKGNAMELIYYGETPVELGGEGDYVLVGAKAAEAAVAAHECKTWGAFARLVKCPWREFVAEWGEEMSEINGGVLPKQSTPFSYADIAGAWHVADLVTDPRQAAHELCWKVVGKLCEEDDELADEIEVSHGSPLGHVQCITSLTIIGFRRLAEMLRALPGAKVRLAHDDDIVARCLLGG